MSNRRKLKGSGVSIQEDLTRATVSLLKKTMQQPWKCHMCMDHWWKDHSCWLLSRQPTGSRWRKGSSEIQTCSNYNFINFNTIHKHSQTIYIIKTAQTALWVSPSADISALKEISRNLGNHWCSLFCCWDLNISKHFSLLIAITIIFSDVQIYELISWCNNDYGVLRENFNILEKNFKFRED